MCSLELQPVNVEATLMSEGTLARPLSSKISDPGVKGPLDGNTVETGGVLDTRL